MPRKSRLSRFLLFTSLFSRLTVGIGSVVLLFGVLLVLAIMSVWWQRNQTKQNRSFFQPIAFHTYQLLDGLHHNLNLVQQGVYASDTTLEDKTLAIRIEKHWKYHILPHRDSLQRLFADNIFPELTELHREVRLNLNQQEKTTQKALQQLQNQGKVSYSLSGKQAVSPADTAELSAHVYYHQALSLTAHFGLKPLQEEMTELADDFLQKNQILETAQNYRLNYWLSITFWTAIGVFVITIWLVVWNVRWWLRYVRGEVGYVSKFAHTLRQGSIPDKMQVRSAEWQPLAHTLNAIVPPLTELREFAKQIGENQFSDAEMFGNQGDLGEALTKMREGLKRVAEENEIRYWTNNGLAKFGEILAKYAGNLTNLADETISGLVTYLHANQGGLFVQETIEKGKIVLELKSSYAYDKKRFLAKHIELGQGLIGQAWKEGESAYFREIPQNYVVITSGLGESTPSVLLLVPLKTGKEVLGVIELASFQEMLPHQRELVERVAENLAQVIANARSSEQTRKLLLESQELTNNLQAQEEQLRQGMTELQYAQSSMETTQKELAEKEANLQALINNTSHAIVAFDKQYKITVLNKAMRQMYLEQGVQLEVGKNLLEEVPQAEFEKHHKEYFRVLAGEKFVAQQETVKANSKTFHELHYNPIFDEYRRVIGASIFVENITQQKIGEIQLKETEANLSSLINDTEDAIMALDKEYKLLIFNEVYATQFAERGFDIQPHTSIFEYLPTEKHQGWKAFYDRALTGERFVKVLDSGKFPNKTYTEHWFNPIRDEKDNITGLSIFARDITEAKKAEIRARQLLLDSLESTENLKQQEDEMRRKIVQYEERIQELEDRVAGLKV
jgi:PAS domain S-box-containing protein